MKKQISAKRALLMSALALVLCVSMLVGSTFAWFTDTASSSVNSIQAGNLNVALEMSEDGGVTWKNAEGETLTWVDSDGNTLWEPGCTYTLPMLRVVNKGNLKLKYSVAISGINGDAKLNEAIEWTGLPTAGASVLAPQATSEAFTIKGHMKEGVGNEYQGLTIDGIAITVYATQVEGEFDSIDDKYDETAPLPGGVIDATFYATLQEAIDAAMAIEGGATVKLSEDVVLTERITIPAGKTLGIDLNGHIISGTCDNNQDTMFMVANTAKLIIEDSVGCGVITYAGNNSTGWIVDVEGDLVLNSGTLKLTGTWNIGYAVDVRPNAWGSDYTAPTTFTMRGGKIVSSDGAVRVASSSADNYTGVSASFTMTGGYIDAAWDGIFVQQSNATWDVLNVDLVGGTVESDLNPIRVYGPAATGYVNGNECVRIKLSSSAVLKYTGSEARSNWIINGMIRYGGGATEEQILADTIITFDGNAPLFDLNAAVANANDGDTIYLTPGVVYEGVKLSGSVAENLTIVGAEGAVVKGIEGVKGTSQLKVVGLTLKDVAFQDKGLYFADGTTPWNYVEDLTMTGCSFVGTGTSDDVIGNRLFDIGSDSPGSNQYFDIVIENCTVSNAIQGIRLGGVHGTNTVIRGNTINNVGHNAVTIRSVAVGAAALVEGNEISNGGDRAFRIGVNQGAVTYKNNEIVNCGDSVDGSNFKANTPGTLVFEGNTVNGAAWNPLA